MTDISQLVQNIRQAIYGEEVRESIAEAIEQCYSYVGPSVREWLDDHPEATTTVQDGSISDAKLATSLKSDLLYKDSLNKEFILDAELLGTFTHSTSQIQGMSTDGTKLYACGTNGDTQNVVIYEINPSSLTVVDHTLSDVYGHPNSADYCNGKLYLSGCMSSQDTADYTKICIVNTTTWAASFVTIPGNVKWWSVALLKTYNNKYVLAGHRANSSTLDLYATLYNNTGNTLGVNRFLPWRSIEMEAFSCDPAGMCQYNNFILIGDAHLSTSVANNAILAYTSEGAYKATMNIPVMGTNELEDICVIGTDIYVVDIAGHLYRASLSPILDIRYEPAMMQNNIGPGLQYAYINENGSETYQTLATNVYLMQTFKIIPWFFPSCHWITDGTMIVRTGTDTLALPAQYEGDGSITFCGTGRSGRALVYYYFKYARSSNQGDDEYTYTLTTFGCTTHYNGTETTYNDPAAAAADGYFHGYSYVRELIFEAQPRYTTTSMSL